MKKRLVVLLLACVTVLAAMGCGSSTKTEDAGVYETETMDSDYDAAEPDEAVANEVAADEAASEEEQPDFSSYEELFASLTQTGEDKNREYMWKLLATEEYCEFAAAVKSSGEPYIYYLDNGKGLGFYPGTTEQYGDCLLYYGDYVDGKRQGEGIWVGACDSNNHACYYCEGEWANDMPNGQQYEQRDHARNLDMKYEFEYSHINGSIVYEGTVKDGLWDGEVIYTKLQDSGDHYDCTISFTEGKWNIVEEIYNEENEISSYDVTCGKGVLKNSMGVHIKESQLNDLNGIEGFCPAV